MLSNFLRITTLVAAITVVTGCDSNKTPSSFDSNGERIYYTGTSKSNELITTTGGDGHGMMHLQMHGSGCASCHGYQREGQRLWPAFWITASALTPESLTNPDSHGHNGNQDDAHPVYDEKSLRRAIIEGVNPAGLPLNSAMPRWSMGESDLSDLVKFLIQEGDPT